MNIKPMEYTCDVLVIGGGYSGSWVAIRAAALGCRVLMADKGPSNWGGLGMMSGGDMIVMQPEFQVNDLLDDLVYYYDGLCDQNQIRTILEASYQRFLELESWGHVFARDESGKLLCVPQPRTATRPAARRASMPGAARGASSAQRR